MLYVTPKQMQQLEQLTDARSISYAEMMERAGAALACEILKFVPDAQHVLFLAGTGNNGGDCYVAAKYLHRKGVHASVCAPLGAPKTEISRAAAAQAAAAGAELLSAEKLPEADVIVDGLFGTGFHGELPEEVRPFWNAGRGEPISQWISPAAETVGRVLFLKVPSVPISRSHSAMQSSV